MLVGSQASITSMTDPNSTMEEPPEADATSLNNYTEIPECAQRVEFHKLPKANLRACVQHVHSVFDRAVTCRLTQDMLSVLLWMLTQIWPGFKTGSLGCTYYEEAYDFFRRCRDRWRDRATNEYDHMLMNLSAMPAPWEGNRVLSLAIAFGYNNKWLKMPKSETKRRNKNGSTNQNDLRSKRPLYTPYTPPPRRSNRLKAIYDTALDTPMALSRTNSRSSTDL